MVFIYNLVTENTNLIIYYKYNAEVWLYKYFDMSVTDESFVDETRFWRTKL